MNEVYLIGNVGRDAVMNRTQTGTAVCNFSLATKEKKQKPANPQDQYETTWHKVTLWGNTAERYAPELKSGVEVFIKGMLQSRKFTDKSGANREEFFIKASWVRTIQKTQAAPQASQHQPQVIASTMEMAPPYNDMDDLPF
jgi:single-strand DNA-binding protein